MTHCYVRDGRARWTIDYDARIIAVMPPDADLFEAEWNYVEVNNDGAPLRRRVVPFSSSSSPAIVHFAGVRYLDDPLQTFNPCQLFLADLYNRLGPAITTRALDDWHRQGVRPRVVVSLTTLPSRIGGVVETIDSLLQQTLQPDAIYLNVPSASERFKEESYVIPPHLSKLDKVRVRRTEDYGPVTKLIPTLDEERDPNTLIITVDDDMMCVSVTQTLFTITVALTTL